MKQDEPQYQFPWTYIAAAVLIAVLMYILLNYQPTYDLACGRWAAKPETANQSCFRNYIFDFQTLITGILAIWAAHNTIKQMRRTDQLSRKILEINVAKDKRIIQRFRNHIRFIANETIDRIENLKIEDRQLGEKDWGPRMDNRFRFTLEQVKRLTEALDDLRVKDSERILDTEIYEMILSIREESDFCIRGFFDDMTVSEKQLMTPQNCYQDGLEYGFHNIAKKLNIMLRLIENWIPIEDTI